MAQSDVEKSRVKQKNYIQICWVLDTNSQSECMTMEI